VRLPDILRTTQCFDLTAGDFDERMAALISSLKSRQME